MDADKPTLIDAKAEFEGTLRGKDVHVFGRFKGEIEITGRLVVGEGGRVEAARVAADSVEIAGDFKGDLKTKSLVLMDKARVDGNLEVQTLAVREGAQLNGAVNTGAHPGARTEPPRPPEAAKPAEPVKPAEPAVAVETVNPTGGVTIG